MMIKLAGVLLSAWVLAGCQGTGVGVLSDLMIAQQKQYQYLPRDFTQAPERLLEQYQNQLVGDTQPYATFRSYPYANYTDRFTTAYPFVVLKVDEKDVKNIPAKFIDGEKANFIIMSHNPLKIPVGQHRLLLVTSMSNVASYTLLPKIDFLPNTDYIIKPELDEQQRMGVRVYTYEYDKRFSPHSPDGIVLKQAVSDPVVLGNVTTQYKQALLNQRLAAQ